MGYPPQVPQGIYAHDDGVQQVTETVAVVSMSPPTKKESVNQCSTYTT